MDMKLEVKVAYSILKDRLELSLSRGWIDEEGAVYLVFSNSKLMRLLGCSKSKLLSIKKTLKEYDLIDEVQQSSSEKGRLANKIYLGELSSTPVTNSNRPSVKKRLGHVKNETPPSHIQPLVRLKLVRLNIVRLILYLLMMRKKGILNLS